MRYGRKSLIFYEKNHLPNGYAEHGAWRFFCVLLWQ